MNKVTYESNKTVISAANLNEIQDELVTLSNKIEELKNTISTLNNNITSINGDLAIKSTNITGTVAKTFAVVYLSQGTAVSISG